ncbi:MAG: HAMP domain-containing sensor histidine kinase [Sulfurospirillum sp.]
MKIKLFIIIIYILAGLFISGLSAFMTYLIIGAPIGWPMVLKIILTVLFMLPLIGLISYLFGNLLSKKFDFIKKRLEAIKSEDFSKNLDKNMIKEIDDINKSMNFLSYRIDNLINDLKQKNQNLSNLLISMAHDIKTPITILNGYIEELEDGLIKSEDLPSALAHMKEEIKFLDELTVDMLEFITSMQEHKMKQGIKLYSFIQNEIFPLLAVKTGVKYINDIDQKILLEFNKIDLKKVVLNLLNNAVKYTDCGYIKVYNKNHIIVFENSGKKIEEEFKDKIFEPFFTISQSKNRKVSGFGLGLSIVKNLCKNNGYTCTLHSSDTIKTNFYLKKDMIK